MDDGLPLSEHIIPDVAPVPSPENNGEVDVDIGEKQDTRLTETPPEDSMASVIGQPQQQPSSRGTTVAMNAEETFLDKDEDEFVDEPVDQDVRSNSPKRTGRRRGRAYNPSQKSYWSSDEESFLPKNQQLTRPKSPKVNADGTPGKMVTFGRNRKTRGNKRRTRRAHDDDEEDDSIADEDAPQRTNPAIALNTIASPNTSSPDSTPPPISVVRTKNKSKSPLGGNSPATASPIVVHVSPRVNTSPPIQHLSIEDMEICQRLDDEYEYALEEREIGYMARYSSVRQAACFSVVFMLIFLSLGTTFFMRYADWNLHESLLFSIYTITTVGYGNQKIPNEAGFQCFTILYIFVGIATLTIMVAQIYQCVALEASRAQHSRDKTEMASRGLDVLSRHSGQQQQSQNNTVQSSQASAHSNDSHERSRFTPRSVFFDDLAFVDTVMHYYEIARNFFTYNEYGRSLSVLLPFAGLIALGAVVVGPIEGWNVVESLYFAVVSLTTVGFGDYHPRKVASIWFCIFWLPFSVGFMSLFLKNVATFYIRLSAQNINRIERRMRRRLARAKEQSEFERAEALKRAYQGQPRGVELQRFPSAGSEDDVVPVTPTKLSSSIPRHMAHPGGRRQGHDNFDALPTSPVDGGTSTPVATVSRASLFGTPGEDHGVMNRRERILKNSLEGHQDDYRPTGQTMDTMKDVIKAVHKSVASGSNDSRFLSMRSSVMKPVLGNSNEPMRKPSFALRALVQERFAEIIATDIAGFQSSIEIKENTLSVTIDSLRYTSDKWGVPRRARKAFRAVAFEALYFVGEHGLITKGADALYTLSPFEFNGIFSPLLAAMGDAGTMEAWLASTEVLAEYDLRNKAGSPFGSGDVESGESTKKKRTGAPSTSEKLHTATHKIRTEGGSLSSIDRIHSGDAFS